MTSPTDLHPSEEFLFCAKEKSSSRLSGTLPLRDLFQELQDFLPVDILYVQYKLPDGSIALREVGSIRVDFVPLDTSLSFNPLERVPDLGVAGSESDIALPPLVAPSISPVLDPPKKPKKPRRTKMLPTPPSTPLSAKTAPLEAPTSFKGQSSLKPSPAAVGMQNGAIQVDAVIPCPPGKEQEYSKFGKSKHLTR